MPVRGLVTALLAVLATAGCAQASPVGSPKPVPASPSAPSSAAPASTSITASAARSSASAAPSVATTSLAAQAIPWLDQPVAKVMPLDDGPYTRPVLYRPCLAEDLATSWPNGGVGMGTRFDRIVFTNASANACTLTGSPRDFVGITSADRRDPLPVKASGRYGTNMDAVANLKPGERGQVELISSDQCGTQTSLFYPAFSFSLPGGGELTTRTPGRFAGLIAGCPYEVSLIGVPHHFLPEPTYPIDPIKATIQAPTTVTSGAPFDYTVTLTNPTSKAISLTPCPSYEETAFRKPDPHPDDQTYQLNCDGHAALAPGESLTFAMHTGGIGPTGQGQIVWRLQQSNVGASVWLTIT